MTCSRQWQQLLRAGLVAAAFSASCPTSRSAVLEETPRPPIAGTAERQSTGTPVAAPPYSGARGAPAAPNAKSPSSQGETPANPTPTEREQSVYPILTPWVLLTATAGLIAFLIGLFTLVGRERKSPYITNTIYPIFLLCLLTAFVALLSTVLPLRWEQPILRCSAALLLLSFAVSAFKVYTIAVRAIYFVDTVGPKNWPFVRDLRRRKALKSPRPNYAHNAVPITPEVKHAIIKSLSSIAAQAFEDRTDLDPQALALAVQHQGQGNSILAQLAETFLLAGYSVQYLTASRHPIEFVDFLKRHMVGCGHSWEKYTDRIVAIDAYSPHFGFLDSIYPKKDLEIDTLDVTLIKSKMTFAGMHTASSNAFNKLKEQMKETKREPTLVIYEDCYALADLESPEQYRIFVRHVMPSERMWEGMFTVFLESAMADADWKMLQACASMRLDLRDRGKTGVVPAVPDMPSGSSPRVGLTIPQGGAP